MPLWEMLYLADYSCCYYLLLTDNSIFSVYKYLRNSPQQNQRVANSLYMQVI